MVIKYLGCLGGRCSNIGTNLATRTIGAIGRNLTRFGIKPTSQAFKAQVLFMFPCPIHSGETNSELRRPGER
jgi:hypothetical protein